jgi:hypothetical protein
MATQVQNARCIASIKWVDYVHTLMNNESLVSQISENILGCLLTLKYQYGVISQVSLIQAASFGVSEDQSSACEICRNYFAFVLYPR